MSDTPFLTVMLPVYNGEQWLARSLGSLQAQTYPRFEVILADGSEGEDRSVQKVLETNTSGAASTADNRMTLFTCVRNERDYRWQVQAVEVTK